MRRAEADEQLGDRPISGALIRAVRHTRLFGDSRQRASRTSQLSADPAPPALPRLSPVRPAAFQPCSQRGERRRPLFGAGKLMTRFGSCSLTIRMSSSIGSTGGSCGSRLRAAGSSASLAWRAATRSLEPVSEPAQPSRHQPPVSPREASRSFSALTGLLRLGLNDFVKAGLVENDPLEHVRHKSESADSDLLILGRIRPIDDDQKPICVA